jgi:hypothetical protein
MSEDETGARSVSKTDAGGSIPPTHANPEVAKIEYSRVDEKGISCTYYYNELGEEEQKIRDVEYALDGWSKVTITYHKTLILEDKEFHKEEDDQ